MTRHSASELFAELSELSIANVDFAEYLAQVDADGQFSE